ncbi:MAG: FAD-dependent oxidoreductase [Candidatus Xenobia bacterium]
MTERFTIVGAGLAGALLATRLAKQGYEVELYERRQDLRRHEVPRGRSINLALSTRGLSALEEAGLREEVLKQAIPMYGRMIHDEQGNTSLMRYSIHPHEFIYSVSRHGLNSMLLDAAESNGVRIHFGQRCMGIDPRHHKARFANEEGHEEREVSTGIVIGADGAHSVVREALSHHEPRFSFSQSFLEWGYKELTMPSQAGQHALYKNALHIWPRHDFMLIALPNLDGSFTCTLFLPFEGRHSFDGLASPDAVRLFFQRNFPDAVAPMPTLVEDFEQNPTSSLAYISCHPWLLEGKLALIGDACHAVVPFYGQGMNAAFEDCSVLSRCLQESSNTRAALRHYQFLRKRNTDALAELSLANFVEMRDHVAHQGFRVKQKVEKALHRAFPDQFVPLYSMVTFSRMPYADALARARRQDQLLTAAGIGAAAGLLTLGAAWLNGRARRG